MNENRIPNYAATQMTPTQKVANIRLLVLDIDGTILDEANHIRDSVGQSIESAQRLGIAVALATGRGYQSSLPTYDSIGSTLPLICYEGALIRKPHTGFVHRHWPLDRRVAAQVLDHIELHNLSDCLSVHLHLQEKVYISNLSGASIRFFAKSTVEPIVMGNLRPLLTESITKMMVMSDESQAIPRLSRQLKNSYSRIQVKQYESITLLEAFHPNASKRMAVSYLAEEIMGLRPENVMAVGDDFTDIEMLQYAGIGIAMGNAPVAVKASADWVTTTIEKDGVARAIEKWILSEESSSNLCAHSASSATLR